MYYLFVIGEKLKLAHDASFMQEEKNARFVTTRETRRGIVSAAKWYKLALEAARLQRAAERMVYESR